MDNYRTIVTHSYDDIIKSIEANGKSESAVDLLIESLPLIFYYLKCSLPFEEIVRLIANITHIPITIHDLFHIIFQMSDPVLKGLCIEHYSFSNPVPLYYPKLKHLQSISRGIQFEICKELWYCLEQYNGLISFGLGRANWNTVGKSTLLDLIFATDFVVGSPQNSAFHFQSIDIQLTKNLFGETKKDSLESTKWAYIDCHSYSDLSVIQALCSHLDVALIHVCYNDYKNNKAELDEELSKFKLKHIYILIRDCDLDEVNISDSLMNGASETTVFIPDLTRSDVLSSYSVMKSLKNIGHKIIHSNPKVIQSQFIYEIMCELESPSKRDIEEGIQLIQDIVQHFDKSDMLDFSVLNYYPNFVKFMSLYHKTCFEIDQKTIDDLNFQSIQLDATLRNTEIGNIVMQFISILEKENSTLILCKLSKELSRISKLLTTDSTIKNAPVREKQNDKYTLEILWRETLLTHKYAENAGNLDMNGNNERFGSSYSRYVGSGEAFELIDGDNLRFFSKEIDFLLNQFYAEQCNSLDRLNEGKSIEIKPAPIVVSILGPQSSGKSTLLNYCFGCKFLTSAGRCTRGIYGSLSKLDRPVNLSQSFLILDTEGLDAIERENIKDTSMIHFDRTMVLFCLAVSQVVIINIKGDIGSEVQNLLQICAHSLDRLKVSKVKAPEIFFVLNQQADPDPNKHLDTIKHLMEKLDSESELLETEGVKISDLIQVSSENLFILPSAFNSQQMNDTSSKIFDSDVIKLSPTIPFAKKCTDLRLAIINKLDHMPMNDRAPFQSMSEWMEMAGVIWDTIIKYQDIVKYKNVEELKCCNKLEKIVTSLIEKHITCNQNEFTTSTNDLCQEIKKLDSQISFDTFLTDKNTEFNEVFEKHYRQCDSEFSNICQKDSLLRRMEYLCKEAASNIKRLFYVVRKQYEDKISLEMKSILTEIKWSEDMKKFQSNIKENIEVYCTYAFKGLKIVFEEIWREIFGTEDYEEENREREENFSNLYALFKMEYNAMENKQEIYKLFHHCNFDMQAIIDSIESEIRESFTDHHSDQSKQFVYTVYDHYVPIKDMVPYNTEPKYSYLCQSSLYKTHTRHILKLYPVTKLTLHLHIPSECESLLQLCSGFYNHPDIIWKSNKNTQVTLLKSYLKDPEDFSTSTWEKFVNDISSDVMKKLNHKSDVTPAVVKEIIHKLCFRIKLLNYEIGFIHANLSNIAERTLV